MQPRRGCGGGPDVSSPGTASPSCWLDRLCREEGSKHSHVQLGLSKHCFLLPPSAASAAVASGWLTMLAGAGALRLGRVTSLNCPRRQLPPAHLACCLPGERWGAQPDLRTPSWVAVSTQPSPDQEAGDWWVTCSGVWTQHKVGTHKKVRLSLN